MQLSKETVQQLSSASINRPSMAAFSLPEKVIQFGTGVLLRGLPDYFIDKANRNGHFNGRIVVVKSTDAGDATAFNEQDNLYTLCIRGIEEGRKVEETIICSAISRVLSAKNQWDEVLKCAGDPSVQIVISNTTEVGIQLVKESVTLQPPASFPAKLLAFLYARFNTIGDTDAAAMVILPTELISDNGKKLEAIVMELAQYNQLEEGFMAWIKKRIYFCNTLVDCIVPGKPEPAIQKKIEEELGYADALLTVSEVYRLWAIEGTDAIKPILSFAETDNRIIITPDITKYKELKLRLLNGTHTLSCGLSYLAGVRTVKEAMENEQLSSFIHDLMLHELAPAVPFGLADNEAHNFGQQVLDRFRNPAIQHQWLSITMQYSSKMAMRTIPVLIRYYNLFQQIPPHFTFGFAAYLLFSKGVKWEDNIYWGESNGQFYPIKDDQAGFYFDLWKQNDIETVVHTVLENEDLWGTDLLKIEGFKTAVLQNLQNLMQDGVPLALTKYY